MGSKYQFGVHIIVVNYQTGGDLRNFLNSFRGFRPTVPYDLTVFNVSPGEDDRDFFSEPGDTYLEDAENIGYARAVNRASTLSDREVLAIFNADVVLSEAAVDRCYGALMARDDLGALGPLQVNAQGKITHAGIFGTRESPRHRGWMEYDRGQYSDVRDDAVTIAGSAYFVKRSAWDELTNCPLYQSVTPGAVGAFLETHHYWEETFCSYHLTEHDWRVAFFGPVKIIHLWHQASQVGGTVDSNTAASKELFRRACDVHCIPHD